MVIKLAMLIAFFAVMIGIGLYCRKHATDVKGFVLGGRSVGPWLTAFAYGTSYFSAVVFVGYAGTVRMEIRDRIHMDRPWERCAGFSSRVGRAGQAHEDNDTAS